MTKTLKLFLKIVLFTLFLAIYNQGHAEVISAGTVTISSSTTYTNLTIESGGTLVLNNILTVNGDVVIESGGTITHSATAVSSSWLYVNGNILIEPGGTIDMSGKGKATTGATTYQDRGASYGGVGFRSHKTQYGDIQDPHDVGSYGYRSAYEPGGGLVRITARILINNGTIKSDSIKNTNYGLGSGGSINIDLSSYISGTGTYSAISPAGYGGRSGGGGRIAITYSFLSGATLEEFKSNISAVGTGGAGPGTIYLNSTDSGDEYLIVKDDATRGDVYLPISSFSGHKTFHNINLRTAFDWTGENFVIPDNTFIHLDAGFTSTHGVTFGTNSRLAVDSTFSFPSSMTIPDGVIFYVNSAITINGDLTVESGGTITHYTTTSTSSHLNINGDLIIDSGGTVNMTGRGTSSTGYGGGQDRAGSYGGKGYRGSGQSSYGDVYNPIHVGSYGYTTSRPGGGLVRVSAVNLINNGTIQADATYYSTYGIGSGGSINIDLSGDISGTGTYSAKAPNGQYDRDGGGGRIAIKYATLSGLTIDEFKAKISAVGEGNGGPGTIYIKDKTTGDDYLIVKDDATRGDVYLPISSFTGSKLLYNLNLMTAFDWTGEDLVVPASTFLYFGAPFTTTHSPILGESSRLAAGSTFDIAGGLTIPDTTIVYVNSTTTINGDLLIEDGGYITHYTVSSSSSFLKVNGDITIDTGGGINMTNRGNASTGAGSSYNKGGTYGGQGKNNSDATYGDVYNPIHVGSYGYINTKNYAGGLIRLQAVNFTNNGVIQSNATKLNDNAGGSGGSINIDISGAISGTGSYQAKGADSKYDRDGGGGRIAIKFATLDGITIDDLKTNSTAIGGGNGGAGTIYIKNKTTGYDYLVIKDNGSYGANSGVGTGYSEYSFDEIDILDGGKLYLTAAETIYGVVCTLSGSPVGVVGPGISCNQEPGFVNYDLGVALTNYDSTARKYVFSIEDQPSGGGTFVGVSSGNVTGNGNLSARVKMTRAGSYTIKFELYDGTGVDAEIIGTGEKTVTVNK